jgi:subtilisin family serine protease
MTQAVRIGIVDSGVHVEHPHVGGIAGGVTIEADGYSAGYVDCLGHGTAIAALIHSLAPDAGLFAVRVFDRSLATSMTRVIRAIDWCLENDIRIINLSLGTVNQNHRDLFVAAVDRVNGSGAVLISAYEMNGQPMLPGSLPGVIAVSAAPDCPREEYRVTERNGKRVFCAPPFPRDIPGVPREHNLNGVSFAVAHLSAHLARGWSAYAPVNDWEQLLINRQSIPA